MARATAKNPVIATLQYVGIGVVSVAVIILLMMLLMRVFHEKVPEEVANPVELPSAEGVRLKPVEQISVPVEETAVGTVRPVHETSLASKILAKVVEVNVKAGQSVNGGDVLVRLDDSDLIARRNQARAALQAAVAARDQAKTEYDRVMRLKENNAVAEIEVDRATNALRSAEAELDRAEQALEEAKTILGYATITSPMDGRVIDKRVDVGDTVSPGQVLLTLYDPTRMQLVASVREALAHRLEVGQPIDVKIEAVTHRCTGRISEIVPEAEAATRTFSVKVTGPCPPGVYPGMFGRLIIPLDQQEIFVIPDESVRRVGQLTLVEVAGNGKLHRRAVELGKRYDDRVEVLAGLRPGEQVALRENATTQPGI